MKLVIVESPTKAKTISKFLGGEYKIESSYGHVRDLPKSKLGIDPERDFEPQYVIPRKAQSRVTELKKLAGKADGVILASDEDREGEAIAWHIASILTTPGKAKKAKTVDPKIIERIVFHEITESAIKDALKHPRALDAHLVDAQQARRVLDRLVGYKLSPFLWKKIARGLSAGRVQSVALRLIAEREEEIKNFKPEKYWTISADLKKSRGGKIFEANLQKIGDEPLPKLGVKSAEDAAAIVHDLESAKYAILAIERKEQRKNPSPPFTTSTLQQAGASRLGFSSKKTMFLAQSLYENGHITYMRTDSVNLSQEALGAASAWIKENLGEKYAADAPRVFKTKSRMAQEAHEAIRPTNVANDPDSLKLEKDERRVYDLIWRRFVASQLPAAVFDATRVEISAKGKKNYALAANVNVLKFDGYLKIWPAKFEEKELPALKESDALDLEKVNSAEHETEPPPRYNEASLIKTLEKYGIGRPSTYAPTISVIQTRNYVEKNQGRFFMTEIGTLVNKVLVENFPEVFNIQFTAQMEEELDEIADGEKKWQDVIKEFYTPFNTLLEKKYEEVKKEEVVQETTDKVCPEGHPMLVKFGRFGKFLACSKYPEHKYTEPLKDPPKTIGMKCPKCLEDPERKNDPGDVIERRVSKGRARGKIFWGCNKYPKCDWASWTNPLNPPEKKTEESTSPQGEE